jgi:4-hydroxybenzoate polyprenyltransferase
MAWTVLMMLVVSVVSAGLYGFGMSLNDLLDARHDRLFAPRRPIPSGRVAPRTAIVVALLLLMLALFAAAMQSALTAIHNNDWLPWPFFFAFATAILIVVYDAFSKYLGAIGILTLGAVRALHCLIGNPKTQFLFISMFLLTHIFLVTLLAYKWENKRPRLGRWDVALGFAGLLVGNALAILYMYLRGVLAEPIWTMLIGPVAAAVVFALWTWRLARRQDLTTRKKGERLMLLGLFWLFVYDASMLFSNGQWLAGVAVVLLFICALGSFFALRTLGRLISGRAEYRLERASEGAT